MTKINRRGSLAALLGIALTAGCGLLDTETPNVINPDQLNTPEAAEALRLGALADFGFVKDGDGTQIAGRPHPGRGSAFGRVRPFDDAAVRAGDRSAHHGPGQSQPLGRLLQPPQGPRRGGKGGRARFSSTWSPRTRARRSPRCRALPG